MVSRKPLSIEQELERLQSKKSISDDLFDNNNINSLNYIANKECTLSVNSLFSTNLKTKDLLNLQNNNFNLSNNQSFSSNSGLLDSSCQENCIINNNKLEVNKDISEKNLKTIFKENFSSVILLLFFLIYIFYRKNCMTILLKFF